MKNNQIINRNDSIILEDGQFLCGYEGEKMSKAKFNVVNPDEIIISFFLSTNFIYPFLSIEAMSPVLKKPSSVNAFFVSFILFQ